MRQESPGSSREIQINLYTLGSYSPTPLPQAESVEGEQADLRPYGNLTWLQTYFDLIRPRKHVSLSFQGGPSYVLTNQKHPPHGDLTGRPGSTPDLGEVTNFAEPHQDDSWDHSPLVASTDEDKANVLAGSFQAYLNLLISLKLHSLTLQLGPKNPGTNTWGNTPNIVSARPDAVAFRVMHNWWHASLIYLFNGKFVQPQLTLTYRYSHRDHAHFTLGESNIPFKVSDRWQIQADFYAGWMKNGEDVHDDHEDHEEEHPDFIAPLTLDTGTSKTIGGGLNATRSAKHLNFSLGVLGGYLHRSALHQDPTTGLTYQAQRTSSLLHPYVFLQENRFGFWTRGAAYFSQETFPRSDNNIASKSFQRKSAEVFVGYQTQVNWGHGSQLQINAALGYLGLFPFNFEGKAAHTFTLNLSLSYLWSRQRYLKNKEEAEKEKANASKEAI